MTVTRVLRTALIGIGLALALYGARLVTGLPRSDLMSAGVWAVGGLILHDGVFAPVCLALGHGVRRFVPARWWPRVLVAAMLGVTVIALAVPVLVPRHGVVPPGGATILNRPYGPAVAAALGAIVLAVAVPPLIRHMIRRRRRHSRRPTLPS